VAGGVFCIENWSERMDSRDTVLPLLEFLERSGGPRVIHQRVQTKRELGHYLSKFAELKRYPVGYLAVHGKPGGLWVGSEPVKLETLTAWSEMEEAPALDGRGEPTEWVLDLRGKVLYLGSCATLEVSPDRLKRFRTTTGAIAVCGYTKSIDWFESGGFDVTLLSALADALDKRKHTARPAIERLRRDAGNLLDRLGFVCDPPWHEGR
jgi:hypothetical protein